MVQTSASLLLIDPALTLAALFAEDGVARRYRLTSVPPEAAAAALGREGFEVALVNHVSGTDGDLDAVREIKALAPDTEIIVLSGSNAVSSAVRSYDLAAFAFVQTPVAVAHLTATIDRALEHRRITLHNRQLHESVSRAKREWERTFDAISDPIAVFDAHGMLLRANTALAATLGLSVRSLGRITCEEVGFCGGKCPACAVGRALNRGIVSHAEITRTNDEIFSVTTFPVGSSEGASVVQVAKNMTEEIRSARRLRQITRELEITNAQLVATVDQLKSTQAQLLQAEKLSAIGQLVAGVAHELNNPLTCVIGYAQLLEEELLREKDSEGQRPASQLARDLHRIAEESERAARIVRNLLAFARRQPAARQPQDLADLIGRVVSLRTYDLRLNAIELATDFAPGLPPVVADGGQLQQALLNLILNAEQAMRESRTRRLTVGARFDAEASAIEFFVADTGHGIDRCNLSRIFDPFFTTRDVGEGTGLGLSICYGIVHDHGGEILVESQVNQGTTFTVRLPAHVEQPGTYEPILVAHADQAERDFLVSALTGWGYEAVGVGHAHEALDRYRQGNFAAVVLGRTFLGADGEGWRGARAADPRSTPIVLLTVAGDDDTVGPLGGVPPAVALTAPFQLRALRTALRAVAKERVIV